MAIVRNKATEIGDIILIKAESPVIGLIALQSFADTTVGETGTRYFDKYFKYSFDGIHFSEWIELTIGNVQAVPVQQTDIFMAEYMYVRAGTDPVGVLEFDDVTITGDVSAIECGKAFQSSIFAEYFSCDNVDVLNWAVNVLQKLYDQGIVPRYLLRGEDNKQRQDEDYVSYWFAVTTFFAFLVKYSREFETFYDNTKLIGEYIIQKGLHFCDLTLLAGLQEIKTNMLREFRKRGSIKMYEPKEVSGDQVHGELLRLICYDKDTEFILGLATYGCATWNLDNTSPLYQGVSNCLHLVKGYEWTDDVLSLTPYPMNMSTGTATANITDGTKKVMRLTGVAIAAVEGIGNLTDITTKGLVIDSSYNYEITFKVRITNAADKITFGCYGFDVNNNQVSLKNAVTGANTNYFFQQKGMNLVGEYYYVRGIIYKSTQPNLSAADGQLNIGFGQHLRFNASIIRIIPVIQVDNTGGAGATNDIYLWDIKINPVSLNYSHAYLDQGRWVDIILKNQNGNLSDDMLEEEMRRNLIPYNTSFHNIYL